MYYIGTYRGSARTQGRRADGAGGTYLQPGAKDKGEGGGGGCVLCV